MEKRTLVPWGIVGIVIVLILVFFIPVIPFLNTAPAPTTCSADGGRENSLFMSNVYGTEDSLSFQYTPKDAKPATYYTSYEIYEYGSPIISEQNKAYDYIAPANPIVINFSRTQNATYTMNMSIWKNGDACSRYQSRVSIGIGRVT